jgi:hypothetical protein
MAISALGVKTAADSHPRSHDSSLNHVSARIAGNEFDQLRSGGLWQSIGDGESGR